jgi:hypothetical protein
MLEVLEAKKWKYFLLIILILLQIL